MRNPSVVMAFVLLTILTAACEPESAEAGPVDCAVVADPPSRVRDANRIEAKVRFRCEQPGAEVLSLDLRLQKQDGEQWHTVESRKFTLRGEDTHAPELKYQSRQITINCASGSYRTVVDWERRSRRNTKGDNLESGTTPDPCKPLLPLR